MFSCRNNLTQSKHHYKILNPTAGGFFEGVEDPFVRYADCSALHSRPVMAHTIMPNKSTLTVGMVVKQVA